MKAKRKTRLYFPAIKLVGAFVFHLIKEGKLSRVKKLRHDKDVVELPKPRGFNRLEKERIIYDIFNS